MSLKKKLLLSGFSGTIGATWLKKLELSGGFRRAFTSLVLSVLLSCSFVYLILRLMRACGQLRSNGQIMEQLEDQVRGWILWGYSSTSELFRLPEWWEEILASGRGSFGERSPLGSRFPESLFLVVPGTATEQVRTCGFRRNASSLDRSPKIRDSVRLNSFESFLITLPSISSETCETYSWAISGSSVFCNWPFLAFSAVFLETAANFLLILKVAMILRKKFCQRWRLSIKRKRPTLAGKKHSSVHFFPHGPRLLHLSTKKVRIQSVRNGHQSGYSRAHTISNNMNKKSEKFSIRGS